MSEKESSAVKGFELAGFISYQTIEALKWSIPIIIVVAVTANFIEKLTLVLLSVGSKG